MSEKNTYDKKKLQEIMGKYSTKVDLNKLRDIKKDAERKKIAKGQEEKNE